MGGLSLRLAAPVASLTIDLLWAIDLLAIDLLLTIDLIGPAARARLAAVANGGFALQIGGLELETRLIAFNYLTLDGSIQQALDVVQQIALVLADQ